MKTKIIFVLTLIVVLANIVVFATEVNEPITDRTPEDLIERVENEEPVVEQPIEQPVIAPAPQENTTITSKDYISARETASTIVEKLNNREVYSTNGWKQDDTLEKLLSNNEGFKDTLWENGIEGVSATIDNIEFGRTFGSCSIDLTNMDLYMAKDQLEDNMSDVIRVEYDRYVEVKCQGVFIGLLEIENERIKNMIPFDEYYNETVEATLNQGSANKEIFIINSNKYISGILVNDGTTEYILKGNLETGYKKLSIEDTLKEMDAMYVIDNPRIDYEAIEAQQRLEAEQQAKRNKKRDIITYSALAVMGAALIALIIFCWKKFVSIDE